MKTIIAWLSLTAPALAETNWEKICDHVGGGAPAPEIGAGVLGVILSVAAVKWAHRRAKK